MLFNSINYFIFLPLVFIIYYLLPERFRWVVLLIASIFFYIIGGITTIFVPVIIILITFFSGILIERTTNLGMKKTFYLSGILINLGLLIFYKYINFFIATAFNSFNFINHLFKSPGDYHSSFELQLIVPLGISYITFQAIGYLIEIKRGNQQSEKNLGYFATYLLFFPKIFSGPIERAHHFIPQLYLKHTFNYHQIVNGLKRILWGLFKKIVVANRLAIYTDAVFNNAEHHSGITLLVAVILFTVQLYADFSGYTDMAIGSAQIFGYRLIENFDRPFISKSLTEFWRRWHISLTTWVNEYIYNPIVISYRRWNKWAVVFAAMITFLILGFWHGASWNYVIFGFLQGLMLSIEFLTRKIRKAIRNNIPSWLNTVLGMSLTLAYFSFSLIFFKTQTPKEAFYILKSIIFLKDGTLFIDSLTLSHGIFATAFLIIIELTKREGDGTSLPFNTNNWLKEHLAYSVLFILILMMGVFDGNQFIYFQF